jgi:hypothetical protein
MRTRWYNRIPAWCMAVLLLWTAAFAPLLSLVRFDSQPSNPILARVVLRHSWQQTITMERTHSSCGTCVRCAGSQHNCCQPPSHDRDTSGQMLVFRAVCDLSTEATAQPLLWSAALLPSPTALPKPSWYVVQSTRPHFNASTPDSAQPDIPSPPPRSLS